VSRGIPILVGLGGGLTYVALKRYLIATRAVK
jgi:hypothetical protein